MIQTGQHSLSLSLWVNTHSVTFPGGLTFVDLVVLVDCLFWLLLLLVHSQIHFLLELISILWDKRRKKINRSKLIFQCRNYFRGGWPLSLNYHIITLDLLQHVMVHNILFLPLKLVVPQPQVRFRSCRKSLENKIVRGFGSIVLRWVL